MKPDHAYDPICPCNFCGVTAWHLSGNVIKPNQVPPGVIVFKPRELTNVVYVDFKLRKRL